MMKNILQETEVDVNDWANNHMAEMDEMKKTEMYRREFLSNVSHELKTPIFNIQGYLHTLIDGGLKDKKINKKYLDKAAKNLDHLTHIVNDLEIISRLESGEQPINMQKFDIHNLSHDIIDELELLASKKDITITFKEGCNKPMFVIGDKEKVKQVLVNLVTNSIRYGNDGGKSQIGIYDMADNVLIEVSDTGIGIPQEHISRLFERFYRVDKSRSKDEGGSGLGLAIVKHIIEAHNQTVNVRSTVGVGSTFGFTLKKA
jgi:two-component system phosphate regulon sensor histidine kinase PhoR